MRSVQNVRCTVAFDGQGLRLAVEYLSLRFSRANWTSHWVSEALVSTLHARSAYSDAVGYDFASFGVRTSMAEAKGDAPQDAPTLERRAAGWVGAALRVEGRITSSTDLTIDGAVEGSIEVGNRRLVVGAGAAVRADLNASHVTIHGNVVGNVRASEVVDLRATSAVTGDIIAPRVLLAEGAVVAGRIETAKRKGA